MRFSTRVFLASVTVSVAGVLVASSLVYVSAERLYRRQYNTLYRQRMEMVARDFLSLETAYDRVALNAAQVVRERDRQTHGKLGTADLARLARELGVRKIALTNAKGEFVTASNGVLDGNLFSFCSDYRGLVRGSVAEQKTPLLPDRADPSIIAKYALVPRYDHLGVIDVSVRFSEVGTMLQQLVDDESDIEHLVLKAPSGVVLGEVRNAKLASELPLPTGETELRAIVAAKKADCCECQAGSASQNSQPYTYEFVGRVTLKSLNESIAHLRREFALIFALVLAQALAVSYWVSHLLVRKVETVRRAMDDITTSGDFTRALPIAANPDAADEIDALAGHFNQMASAMREAQKAEARAAVAAQVAHDIRSPLTTMTLALNQLQTILQKTDVQARVAEMLSALSNGISRVNGIVNRLSGRKLVTSEATPVEAPRLTLVDRLLFDVAQETALKLPRTQTFNIVGFEPVPSVWAVVQVTELQAAFSNLLNNAFEAVGSSGQVELSCMLEIRALKVSIKDNGVGISAENLTRVFEREFTSGKTGGSGLGLFQAKKAIEWGGGTIAIESTIKVGTTVRFTIPIEKAPAWLTSEIALTPGQALVVADDDPAVLLAWRQKASAADPQITVHEFESIQALEEALTRIGAVENLVFIVDQYAGDGRNGLTGLAFIESHGLGGRACLSTSEFDDPVIQDRVKKSQCKMIPKPRLAAARIVVRR